MRLLSTVLLALCNSDVSLSFLASSHRRGGGKVNAVNVESPFSGRLFFYSGDDYYDDTIFTTLGMMIITMVIGIFKL